MKTLALEIFHPTDYPPELVDRAQDFLTPFLQRWAAETFTEFKRLLRKDPTKKFAMMLNGVETPFSHQGQQIFAMFAMKYYRGEASPEFTCFMETGDKIKAERDRILAEVETDSINRKLCTTITEAHS